MFILWDVATQQRGWITGDWELLQEAYLGDYTPLKRTFLLDDLLPLYAAARVTKVVHVQADWGGGDQVDETRWVNGLALPAGFPIAIVAGADLRASDARDELERHLDAGPVRGVRMLSYYENLFEDDAFLHGLDLLEELGLLFGIGVMWDRLNDALALARRRPGAQLSSTTPRCPNRARPRQPGGLEAGHARGCELRERCREDLGPRDGSPSAERRADGSARPRFTRGVRAVSRDARSNWPVDSLFGEFGALIVAFEQITAALSEPELRSRWRGQPSASIASESTGRLHGLQNVRDETRRYIWTNHTMKGRHRDRQL